MILIGVSPVLARIESSLSVKGSSWSIWVFLDEMRDLMTMGRNVKEIPLVIPVRIRTKYGQIGDCKRTAKRIVNRINDSRVTSVPVMMMTER
jgi:hypothetical protein